jgi:hypothetical protein
MPSIRRRRWRKWAREGNLAASRRDIEMKSMLPGRAIIAAAVVSQMGLSYAAGAAQPVNTEAVTKLEQSVPFLEKAQALLDAAPTNRQGYANVAKAKADIVDALKEIDKAVKANGG